MLHLLKYKNKTIPAQEKIVKKKTIKRKLKNLFTEIKGKLTKWFYSQ